MWNYLQRGNLRFELKVIAIEVSLSCYFGFVGAKLGEITRNKKKILSQLDYLLSHLCQRECKNNATLIGLIQL
jgi:hypothetical protein